jgi:hypothetical protein
MSTPQEPTGRPPTTPTSFSFAFPLYFFFQCKLIDTAK